MNTIRKFLKIEIHLILMSLIFPVISCNELNEATISLPLISTEPVLSILTTSARSGGIVLDEGGSVIIARGVCWSTETAPTVELDSKTFDGSGLGSFTSNISDLSPGTTYYLRAYATNEAGTSYGNEINFVTAIAIGSIYKGGKVAYILQPGDPGYVEGEIHGLIATEGITSLGIKWYTSNTLVTGATDLALGAGKTNTDKIVAIQGTGNYAAKLCFDLIESGFDDWYLPSYHEMIKLYTNRIQIGGFLDGENYWTSSEVGGNGAYSNYVYAQVGPYTTPMSKPSDFYVRAVRNF
ncbi:MAG: DUF1566 domain-containing protein [Cyclobacteriaceae bacterium]|nr:DUF1566 domain-containing protein [Cyclobacteriaceae bacterium]